ncbi:MAG: hypothetical protein AAGJ80_08615, partial [Cyanobacteria bacterium J06553_1]
DRLPSSFAKSSELYSAWGDDVEKGVPFDLGLDLSLDLRLNSDLDLGLSRAPRPSLKEATKWLSDRAQTGIRKNLN